MADKHHTTADDASAPIVPVGVLRGIENIAQGKTATRGEIAAVLKF
jgi:hypothetical protein